MVFRGLCSNGSDEGFYLSFFTNFHGMGRRHENGNTHYIHIHPLFLYTFF